MKRWLGGLMAVLVLVFLTACGGLAGPAEAGARLEDERTDLAAAEDSESAGDAEKAAPAESPGEEDPPSGRTDPAEDPESRTKPGNGPEDNRAAEEAPLPEDGAYTTKEDVALYIHTYGRLPANFITKKEAQNLGWSGGSLEPYAPGQCLCIGGSRFGNYEGLLPEVEGRTYTECDIDTMGAGSRGAKRIVFSNDGLIYYTEDHYESFELLYGDEGDG